MRELKDDDVNDGRNPSNESLSERMNQRQGQKVKEKSERKRIVEGGSIATTIARRRNEE